MKSKIVWLIFLGFFLELKNNKRQQKLTYNFLRIDLQLSVDFFEVAKSQDASKK